MLIFKFPFGPLETNALLLGCAKTLSAAVIDPSAGSAAPILKKAAEKNLKIEKILLTHSHWDHFADAHLLKAQTGAPLSVHPADAYNLEEPGADGIPLFIPIHPVKVDHFFEEGDQIAVGLLRFEVIHTPGHSPGSVCFYLKEQKLLLSGDTLFRGGIGNLYLPTGEPGRMGESLKKLARLPPDTRVIAGHGADTMIGQEAVLQKQE